MAALAVPIGVKVLGTALASKATSALMGDKAKKNVAQKAPPAMPDEEALNLSAKRNAAMRFGALGSGRSSTILADNSDGKLGA
jgi:hypothetical protein